MKLCRKENVLVVENLCIWPIIIEKEGILKRIEEQGLEDQNVSSRVINSNF